MEISIIMQQKPNLTSRSPLRLSQTSALSSDRPLGCMTIPSLTRVAFTHCRGPDGECLGGRRRDFRQTTHFIMFHYRRYLTQPLDDRSISAHSASCGLRVDTLNSRIPEEITMIGALRQQCHRAKTARLHVQYLGSPYRANATPSITDLAAGMGGHHAVNRKCNNA
jgi:hypothetical protein